MCECVTRFPAIEAQGGKPLQSIDKKAPYREVYRIVFNDIGLVGKSGHRIFK